MTQTIDEKIAFIQALIVSSTNETTKKIAEERLKVLEATKSAGTEGVIYDTLQQLQTLLSQGVGSGNVDETEVKKIVDKELGDVKIGIGNLDPAVMALIGGSTKVSLNLTLPTGVVKSGKSSGVIDEISEPENQIVLSDLLALNNVYMYGAAGTGKSFRAGQIQKILSSEGSN